MRDARLGRAVIEILREAMVPEDGVSSNSSIAEGDQGARRPGASAAHAEGLRPVSKRMVPRG